MENVLTIPKTFVVCDIDGVLTETGGAVGSYITHSGDGYGISPRPFAVLMKLVSETGAKVVVSSNWRRFAESGPDSYWRHPIYGDIRNPLPGLKSMLGDVWYCDLPAIRHVNKSLALRMWFADNKTDPRERNFVIFDDDLREGFSESEFRDRFIHTDYMTGLTDEDCMKAKTILKGEL